MTAIYSGTGCGIPLGAFFRQTMNLGVSFLVESRIDINFGVSF